jgi:hypothetical protein
MRTYVVHVFVPRIEFIEATDEADLLAKIGERYQELYKLALSGLVQPVPQPEDFE